MNAQFPWLETVATSLLTSMGQAYVSNYDASKPEEEPVLPPLFAVARSASSPEGKPLLSVIPEFISRLLMKNKADRSTLMGFIENTLTNELGWGDESNGPAEAFFVLSETWQIQGSSKEELAEFQENYSSLSEHPERKSALTIMVYTLKNTYVFTQEVSDGELVGEVRSVELDNAKAQGNMVLGSVSLS